MNRKPPCRRLRRPHRQPLDRNAGRPVNPETCPHRPRYRGIEIQAGPRTITAAAPVPDDLRQTLDAISQVPQVRTNLPSQGSADHLGRQARQEAAAEGLVDLRVGH
jgi:hypothetical protein